MAPRVSPGPILSRLFTLVILTSYRGNYCWLLVRREAKLNNTNFSKPCELIALIYLRVITMMWKNGHYQWALIDKLWSDSACRPRLINYKSQSNNSLYFKHIAIHASCIPELERLSWHFRVKIINHIFGRDSTADLWLWKRNIDQLRHSLSSQQTKWLLYWPLMSLIRRPKKVFMWRKADNPTLVCLTSDDWQPTG